MRKIGLNIVALSHSVSQSHNYAVVLGEEEGNRRLPIVIGSFEAQAIAVAMENMAPSRPLTHDLFKNALKTFDIHLREVIINNLLDGIFYARLICTRGEEVIEVDSRTSDALALAVRFECPIYTYEFVLDAAGIVLEDSDEDFEDDYIEDDTEREVVVPVKGTSLSAYSVEDLTQMLNEVLSEENYERAAEIRDELNKRSKDSE
ncbi:MAG: bifunctional nuclease family protein [Saprospiraceae bacterium]|jgi:bifunctional DNase/RNase|nr:bifunctional nuclease family protein [Saprospiraceae bacterium]